MKMYHPDNNEKWLEFTDHNFESPAEEFREVMTILRNGGCEYESKYLLPEQEFYKFTLNGEMFAISTDNFDRKGCTVCTYDDVTISLIEKILTDAGVEWCEKKNNHCDALRIIKPT